MAKFGVRLRIIEKGNKNEEDRLTTIAMIQTLAKRSSTDAESQVFDSPMDFVLVDEAHHSTAKSYMTTLGKECREAR